MSGHREWLEVALERQLQLRAEAPDGHPLNRSCAPQQYRSCSYKGYFIDLFVRSSNTVAISMYSKLGYKVYRRVLKWV